MAKRIPSDAFDFYFSLGAGRSYQAVASKFGVSKRGVTDLARREKWQGRITDLETKAREASDKKKVESLEAMRDRHLRAMRFVQGRALDTLKSMPLENAMDAVRALAVSVREERVILGEPGERTAVTVEDAIKREYERWLVPAGVEVAATPVEDAPDE